VLNKLDLSNEIAVTPTATASTVAPPRRWGSPDDLKAIVRDGLILMKPHEREQLIRDLEREVSLFISPLSLHPILIGIPATSHFELTPNDVGHLVRFIDLTVPRLMPAIERVLARYPALWREQELLRPAA
jgi:hypothetical protein